MGWNYLSIPDFNGANIEAWEWISNFILYFPGPRFNIKCHLTSIGNPIVEIRRSYDRLISTMGFPILVRRHLYIESGPWTCNDLSNHCGHWRQWRLWNKNQLVWKSWTHYLYFRNTRAYMNVMLVKDIQVHITISIKHWPRNNQLWLLSILISVPWFFSIFNNKGMQT